MTNKKKIKDSEGTQRESASGQSEAELRYSAIFEQSPYGILLIDTEGKILDFNEKAHLDLGYTREEFANITIADIDPVESAADVKARISRILKKGSAEFETRHRTKEGEIRDVHVITKVLVLSGQTVCQSIWRDITDQKAADKKVRYLASILEHVPDAICSMDTEGRIVSWNEGAERILGYTADEIIGRPIQSIIPEEKSREEVAHCISALNKEGSFTNHVTVRVAKDGRRVPVEISGLALGDGQKITGYASIMRDLTEHRSAEENLQRVNQMLKAITRHSPLAIITMDLEANILTWNPAAEQVFGWTEAEVIGRKNPIVPEDKQEEYTNLVRKVREGVPYSSTELVRQRKDGTLIHLNASSASLQSDDGSVIGLLGIFEDITCRKQEEEAKDRLLKAISAVTEGIAITDGNDRFVYVNDAHAGIYGCPPEELIGKTWRDTVLPELVPLFEKELSKTLHNKKVGIWSGECPAVRKDGVILPVEITATARWDEAGHYLGHICIVRNIADRKKAEEKLRQSEAFIRNILDTVDEGFIVIDRDFRILTANKAYCRQVGEPCASIIGRQCYEISHKTLRPCYEEGEECAVLHVFETGEPHTALHRHPEAKGSILYVETKAFPIKDITGAVTSVIETVNNITEKHLLEEEQLKTQKLEAIGTLAGGIAHDFNNLLQGVFGYISMAKITLDKKERALTMLEQAEKALHMSVNLTTQLLTFSKGGKPAKKKIRIQSVIENSVRFALSGSSVDFRFRFDEDLWTVDADEGQVGQVIQNIVLNADQAMPLGGTITITAKNVCAPEKELPSLLPEGKYIEISVRDNGIGIPEHYLPRLFDPYFTTKEKGSGLGLATSYSIVKNHGGLIEVKSQMGKGSTFFVYLPAVEAEAASVTDVPASAGAARKGRVLVMDDEELIRNIVGIMLRALGHEAEFAENGEKAIAKYREAMSSGRRFDVVILDLTIRGGMGGEEALRGLRALDPEVKAIVSSGYSDSATIAEYESRGFSACLAKPYKVSALGDILSTLLK